MDSIAVRSGSTYGESAASASTDSWGTQPGLDDYLRETQPGLDDYFLSWFNQ